MAGERQSSIAELHSTAVAPRKGSVQDMSGGTMTEKPVLESHSSMSTEEGEDPTEEERHTLLKVADKLPWSAFLVAVVELCERFTYYGLSGPFQNYMANSYNDPNGLPGAIGLDQSGATGLSNFWQFWCYVTPIPMGIIADQYLGKYNTILLSSCIYLVGNIVLFATSLPVAIENGAALGGLVTAMIIIGIGTGGIKANVSPLIAEQYTQTKQKIGYAKDGSRVIIDPGVTIQRIYMIFYLCINLGSLSSIATTNMELHIGFWSAYLLPLIMFCVGITVLVLGRKQYVTRPPKGSVLPMCFKALWIGIKNKGNLDAAKPSYQEEYGRRFPTPWNDIFIDELRRALVACKVFVFFPIYWVTYSQMINNFISQAGQMELHGIPNDLMQNIDPLAIIIFIPIMDRLVYPALRKVGIPMRPITRIFWGFMTGSAAMVFAAITQHLIYQAGPCYDMPLACKVNGEIVPNRIHVAVQTPAYVLIALSEIFASITGLEYAFTKAPPSMKSFVMSLFLVTNAFGSALGAALSPTAVDPKLVWMYTGLAVASFIAGIIFWLLYSRYNATEESMNEIEQFGDRAKPAKDVSTTFGGRKSEDV